MLFRSTADTAGKLRRPVVAIGNFDGVHRGHRAVVERAVAEAERRASDSAVLTFEPHPRLHFQPQTPEFRLTHLEHKAQLLTDAGAGAVVAARFDDSLAQLSAAQFVDDILVDQLGVGAVLVGENFRYGAGRSGDIDTLRAAAVGRFDVFVIDPITDASGQVISSTRVRSALAEGLLDRVTELLGRDFEVQGTVRHGDGLGEGFGFPTANVEPRTPTIPPDGIYASHLRTSTSQYQAATYVGTRPTVGGVVRVVEAYCLDAPEGLDLYGAEASVAFVERVRPDREFESTDAMIQQMHADVAAVRRALA